MTTPIVVVPDGISVVKNEIVPSWVYRAALKKAAEICQPHQKIWLAPANHFGFDKFEQELGGDYLLKNYPQVQFQVILTPPDWRGYVDTLGNAILTAQYFNENKLYPDRKIMLVSAKVHARRAEKCFKKAGFQIETLIEADYAACPNEERIVRRLFYYKYKRLHKIYERIASLIIPNS